MAFQPGDSLFAVRVTELFVNVNPPVGSGLPWPNPGELVGEYTGQRQLSLSLNQWFCQVLTPVPDYETGSMTTAPYWVQENAVGTTNPHENPNAPRTGTPGGGGQPQTPLPAQPGSKPTPTNKPASTTNPVVNFLGALGAGAEGNPAVNQVAPLWLKVVAVVAIVCLLSLTGWQLFRKS